MVRRCWTCRCVCRAAQRLQDAVVRGAAVGLSLRGGLHLVGYLLQLLARRRRNKGPAGSARRPETDALGLLKDTARWGAFLGSFSGGLGWTSALSWQLSYRSLWPLGQCLTAGPSATGSPSHAWVSIYCILWLRRPVCVLGRAHCDAGRTQTDVRVARDGIR